MNDIGLEILRVEPINGIPVKLRQLVASWIVSNPTRANLDFIVHCIIEFVEGVFKHKFSNALFKNWIKIDSVTLDEIPPI